MSENLHRRLRQQLEQCLEAPSALPDSVQALLNIVDDAYREAEIDLKLSGFADAEPSAPPASASPDARGAAVTLAAPRPEISAEALPDIVFLLDEQGTILDCRGGDPKDLAFLRNRLIGRRVTRCPFGDVGPRFAAAIEASRTERGAVAIHYTLPCDNGLAHFEARLLRSGNGHLLAVVRNTTRSADAEAAIRRSELEYREIFYSSPAPILLLDPTSGTIIDCNRRAESLYQSHRADLVGTAISNLVEDPALLDELRSTAETEAARRLESSHKSRDGRAMRMELTLSRLLYQGRYAIQGVVREIALQGAELPAGDRSVSMLKATFDATADGILVIDPEGNFVTCNRLFAEMWKIPEELLRPGSEMEAVAVALAQLNNPAELVEAMVSIHFSNETRSANVVEFTDGRFFECVSMPQLIAGERVGRVWSFRDISSRMRSEERIRHHAYHDSLTGLPNRNLFHDRMTQDLGHSRRAGTNTALLLIDLDRFKTINDTLGHAAGDKLLIEVAQRLSARRREGDTIARLGGDEFVFLVSQLRSKEDAAVVAEQILDVLKPPIQIGEHDLHISASIGIAIFPEDGDEGTTLMKSADVALYRAKELGRNNYQIYEPKLSQRAMERLVLEKDLREAIHRKEFILEYQPQYEMKTGRMRGVEALVRWSQSGTVVPPAKFIPIAEECGLVVPLGRWVLEESARRCAEFNRHSREPLRICVNLSALQIQRPNFANEVSQVLQEAGLPLKQLVLELTESALMQNPEQGAWAMAQLQQMGVGIAMDDFGTGHSSLSHLSHLPISMIKIDRSFVKNCAQRRTDATILEAIITIGHALGLKVLAEGVETEDQARVLRKHGCDEVQGYLYSRPVSAEALITMIRGR